MGYHTDFDGEFTVTPTLKPEHRAYLKQFAETRRMRRDMDITDKRPDPIRKAVGLRVGRDGGYFVGEGGTCGQGDWGWGEAPKDAGILDNNTPPSGQPGLWCQWTPSSDGTCIDWDGGEKFYSYTEWITYLIKHFLAPWGYKLNGIVEWNGEEQGDMGRIVITDNAVTTQFATITWNND